MALGPEDGGGDGAGEGEVVATAAEEKRRRDWRAGDLRHREKRRLRAMVEIWEMGSVKLSMTNADINSNLINN